MRIAVIHPLKHHVYYSMAGVMESGAEVIGLFGYYDKNDFLDKIVRNYICLFDYLFISS